jgi:acetyl-CoA carboxylase biotin carboxyl carrier protein
MADTEVKTEVTGSVWRIVAAVGQKVAAGEPVMIIESMKMEIPVLAERDGVLSRLLVEEKATVTEGQTVAILAEG